MVQEAEIQEVIEQLEWEQNTGNDCDALSMLDKDDRSVDDELMLPAISHSDAMGSFEKLRCSGISF